MPRPACVYRLALLSLVAGAACSRAVAGDSLQSDTVEIGATLPLSGVDAKPAAAFKEGYELAFDEANARGGLAVGGQRKKAHLRLFDDGGSTENAVMLADRLIDGEGVRFMLGTYQSTLVMAQTKVAERSRVPYVNGGGAAAEIYDNTHWVFGLLAPVDLLAYSMMRWMDVEQNNGKLPSRMRIALLWEKTPHGKDFRRGVLDFTGKSTRRRASYEVVYDESYELGSPDAKGIMQRLKAANADAFLADAHLADFLTLQQEYLAAGLCHRVVSYGARGTEQQAAEKFGADKVKGILSAVWWSSDIGHGLNRAFVESYSTRYHKKPEWYSALGYESARALFTAIENAGSLEREKVREALSLLQMASILPGGRLSFQNGHAHYPFVVQQNKPGGGTAIVYPTEFAQARGAVSSCPSRLAGR